MAGLASTSKVVAFELVGATAIESLWARIKTGLLGRFTAILDPIGLPLLGRSLTAPRHQQGRSGERDESDPN